MKNQINTIAKKNNVKLEWINYSIGFKEGKTIYLNENLLKYPDYCMKIFKHELEHSDDYNWNDVVKDMKEPNTAENFRFCLKHPRGFYCLLPIVYFKGGWSIDVTSLVFYLLFMLIITIYMVIIFGL